MIILDATNRSLEIDLAGAVTTNELPFTVSYADINQSTLAVSAVSTNTGLSTGATAATMVSAPGATTSRQIKWLSIYNADTVSATVTVQLNDNTVLRSIVVVTLAVGDTLQYQEGWTVMDSAGGIKPAGASMPSSGTDNAILRRDGATGRAIQDSAVTINDSGAITATGGGSLTGTWTDLGSVTTVDINGGTVDGVTIGGAAAGAGTFTTLTATGAFTSLGIDDNATAERLQLSDTIIHMSPTTGVLVGDLTTTPDTIAHFHKGTAGSVSALTNTVVTLENNTDAGLQFLIPDANDAFIAVGSQTRTNDHIQVTFDLDGGTAPNIKLLNDTGERFRFTLDSTPVLFINDTSNANMAVGLTMNAASNIDHTFTLKGVTGAGGHGLTTAPNPDVETDDFYVISQSSGTLGGVNILALAEDTVSIATPYRVVSWGGQAGTTKTTAGVGLIDFIAVEHDGANTVANVTASGNVFSIRSQVGGSTVANMIVGESGLIVLPQSTSRIAIGGVTPTTTTALHVPAGTTSVSSLRIPHGSAPTSPVNGDMWTTTAGLFVRINGSTVGPLT